MTEAIGIPRPSVFARMEEGRYAALEAEERIASILGVELLGIGFDDYDRSFEIYPESDVVDIVVTPEMHSEMLALGCSRYWINFPDGTERYCCNERKGRSSGNAWERFNRGEDIRRAAIAGQMTKETP